MKVLYIHQYFVTPDEPGGTRSYWFAKELVSAGHEVVMITSTNKYHEVPGRCNIEGITVEYVKNEYSNYMSAFQKVMSFVRFVKKSIKVALKEDNVDLVFATSTPLTVGAIALFLKFVKGWKYVFEVRDLWPEFPIQIGVIRNPLLKRLLYWFERLIYRKSEFVIALSPGMEAGVIKAGTPKEKVCVIPNMSKPEEFYPRTPSKDVVEKFGIDLSKFNIVHFGAMGVANGLEYIIDAAEILENRKVYDVNFIFLGDGATYPMLKDKVEKSKLKNVQFLGQHNMKVVSEIVNCCDASITSFKDLPILYTNSPNKLFDSLSAGKPIIVNSAGWTKDLVEKEKCGFYVNPQAPEDFVNKIIEYKDNKELLEQWGRNSRELSLKQFNRAILAKRFVKVLEKVS